MVGNFFVFLVVVVDYEVLKAKAFNDKVVVDFYGGGEDFTKRIQPSDDCYIKQGQHKHPTSKLKGVSRTFPEED